MEKSKPIKTHEKKQKIGADGLSKKERRAVKVQEKNQQDSKSSPKPQVATSAKLKEVNGTPSVTSTSTPVSGDAKPSSQLSEKELRRLEWDQKLAETKKGETKGNEGLTKAQLRQKRREQQEAQRQAKETAKQEKGAINNENDKENKEGHDKKKIAGDTAKSEKKATEKSMKRIAAAQSKLQLKSAIVNYGNIHPAFIRVGVQHQTYRIVGSNARCISFLEALRELIRDLQIPPRTDLRRYLIGVLDPSMAYLNSCRQFCTTMTNALSHFKMSVRETTKMDDNEKKPFLIEIIDMYIKTQIDKAGQGISYKFNYRLEDGDVFLIYGCSSIIFKILLDAYVAKRKFSVIVTDSRPFVEGRLMYQRLFEAGIQCQYIHLNNVNFVMEQVTKVLLSVHSLLHSGNVISRIGTSQLAQIGYVHQKKIWTISEAYKYIEKDVEDSLAFNELGNPEMMTYIDTLDKISPLVNEKQKAKILNYFYDMTPGQFISIIISEVRVLMPCNTSFVTKKRKNKRTIRYPFEENKDHL